MVVKDKYTKQLNLTIEEFMDMLLDWIHEKSNKLLEHMLQNAKNSEDRQYITLILSHD
jgi:protein associated with RNAse G/E